MIYGMGVEDQLASNHDRYLVFKNMEQLEAYAVEIHLELVRDQKLAVYDFEYVTRFSDSSYQSRFNAAELMDCWNLFDDLDKFEISSRLLYIEYSNEIRYLHERLLFETDVFSDGDFMHQEWPIEDHNKLRKVMKPGLANYKNVIKFEEGLFWENSNSI